MSGRALYVSPEYRRLVNLEARLRRRARRLGLRLVKAREISCRVGRQCAFYGDYTLWDETRWKRTGEWVEVAWPTPGIHVTLAEVQEGLDAIERQRVEAAG